MKTALHQKHLELHAKMTDFCGWEMPIQYQGIIPEHTAVREKVGLFDVSHMGRISITGKDAEAFLDYLSTNKIVGKNNYTATYTVWPNAEGGSVDDVIIFKENNEHFFVIVNACNRQKDLDHVYAMSKGYAVHIQDYFSDEGILALQGPNAESLLSPLFIEVKNLQPMHFFMPSYHGEKVIVSRTGYTGSGGFEIVASQHLIVELWDYFRNEGDVFGLQPIGLGARDTLRLEMGYALYGHELNDSISPNESVSHWTVKWDKKHFLGKEAMQKLEESGSKRHQYGAVLIDGGIAREGYRVYKDDKLIGSVCSGSYAPSLQKAVAIILVDQKLAKDSEVEIQIRQNRVKAKIVSLPFFKGVS